MSWHYLPVQAVDYSDQSCLDGDPSVTSRTTPIASESLKLGLQRAICAMRRYGMILRPLTGVPGLDSWMLSLRDSHASHSQSQESAKGQTTAAICGQKPSGLFGKCEHDMRSVKTCQVLLAGIMDTSDEYLMTFPKAGMMLDGELYRRPTWERPISEKGSGYWRSPASSDGEGGIMEMREGKSGHYKLRDHVQEINKHQWPTPTKQDAENDDTPSQQRRNTPPLNVQAHYPTPRAQKIGGYSSERFRPTLAQVANGGETTQQTPKMQLNPRWVEWLMGFPIGWVSLERLGTHRFQEWLELHGNF